MGVNSRQPRLAQSDESRGFAWLRLLDKFTRENLINVPDYASDSRTLDTWLNEFWRQESLLSGVVSSVVSIDKNRGYTLTGGRNQVARFHRILGAVENGAGWRRFMGLQSQAYWTTNMGALTEIGRLNPGGPMGAMWALDPTRCALTGKSAAPLMYYPPDRSKPQQWMQGDYMRQASLPNIDETYHQLGFCAVMRALQLAIIMVAIYRHDKEMLFAAMPKGLLMMQGIDEVDWEDAMRSNQERLTAKEREFFSGLSIFFSGMSGDIDAKLVSLSQLPANFDAREWTNMLMYGYALAFGYDPREFWPVSGGTLGTGAESQVQAIKASGKGGLDFALEFQDGLQRQLPPTLLFQFDQRNDEGDMLESEAMQAYAEAVNAMAKPSGPGMMEALTVEERRQLYALKGYIPDEWTVVQEDVTATDTENVERERLLSVPQILRACSQYQDEPIVRLSWAHNKPAALDLLWARGALALEPRVSYSIPQRPRRKLRQIEIEPDAILYESGDIVITGEDVQRASQKWANRVDEGFSDLLEARTVTEETEEEA